MSNSGGVSADCVQVKGIISSSATSAVARAEAGLGEQVGGGLVAAAAQLKFTLLVYPFRDEMVPLNVAVCAAKIVKGLFVKLI